MRIEGDGSLAHVGELAKQRDDAIEQVAKAREERSALNRLLAVYDPEPDLDTEEEDGE